jgi:hypothetical protein
MCRGTSPQSFAETHLQILRVHYFLSLGKVEAQTGNEQPAKSGSGSSRLSMFNQKIMTIKQSSHPRYLNLD